MSSLPAVIGTLDRALLDWVESLTGLHEGLVSVPTAEGIPAVALVRFAWRESVAREGWRPLVEARAATADWAADLGRQARGGWLFSPDGTVVGSGVLVLVPGSARLLLSPGCRSTVLRLDAHHVALSDPALNPLRQPLAAHARAGATVVVAGPRGGGKRELVRAIHALSGGPSLWEDDVPTRPAPKAEEWAVFGATTDLSAGSLQVLGARARTPRPLRVRIAGPTGVRPIHPALTGLWGESEAWCETLSLVERIARSPRPTLILGESGTGKEGVARAIHEISGRKGPFVVADVASLPESLVESELFGHARGAFTGADRPRTGLFRAAAGGTIFLDELGNIPPRIQARLLRVLQEHVVQPVGEDRSQPVDVRVVAATNADIETMVARAEFREDLWRRLETFTLRLPALRDRPGDARLLAARFLERERGATARFTPEALLAIDAYPWPGNVRELDSVVAAAALLAPSNRPIGPEHLPSIDQGRRGPVATFVCVNTAPREEVQLAPGLPPEVGALVVRVPALSSRPPAERRALILLLLDGCPIRMDALESLSRRPWWGEIAELRATLQMLVRESPRGIDAAALSRLAPDTRGSWPIRVCFSPTRDPDGVVRGLQAEFASRAVMIGRVADHREVEAILESEPDRFGPARDMLHGATPGVVPLGPFPEVSRLHCGLGRDGDGLVVHAFAWARLPVHAASLDGDAPLRLVAPGRPLPLGPAGEIAILGRDGRSLVRLFAFAGALAWEDYADRAAGRARPPASAPTDDLRPTDEPPTPSRRWVLDPAEQAALAELVVIFPGGEFKAWALETALAWEEEPRLERLAAYVRGAPMLADYIGRMYEYGGNEDAVRTLIQRVGGDPEAEKLLARLPARLRRVLQRAMAIRE